MYYFWKMSKTYSHDKGRAFEIIKHTLEDKLGYVLYWKVLNAMSHANVPQNRERIFIVGFDANTISEYNNFSFPEIIPLESQVNDLLAMGKQAKHLYYQENYQYYPALSQAMRSRNTVYQWRRTHVRENKSRVCPTLTANMGGGGHNVPLILGDFGIRKLSPEECFAFQGFPKAFILPQIAKSKLYKQAGNTVTVPLVRRIAEHILRVLH